MRVLNGLSTEDAGRRHAMIGANALPTSSRHSLGALMFRIVREPMFLLSIAPTAIYIVFGDLTEAVTLGGSVVLIIAILVATREQPVRVNRTAMLMFVVAITLRALALGIPGLAHLFRFAPPLLGAIALVGLASALPASRRVSSGAPCLSGGSGASSRRS